MISAGVLGSPISHSLSPLLHRTAYEILGVEATYNAYEVGSGRLSQFLANEGSELNALSLTMPLKEEALDIADVVSEISLQIASGNTLHKLDSKWHLTSTDVEGFVHALVTNGVTAQGNILIIGSGATARAVAAACDGVSQSITIIHRSQSRVESMRKAAPHLPLKFVQWDSTVDFGSYDLVINTTPGDSASIFLDKISSGLGAFFEVLYNPFPTGMLSRWREEGNIGIDGLDLLIHQAISQVEIFASLPVNRAQMFRSLRQIGEKALS